MLGKAWQPVSVSQRNCPKCQTALWCKGHILHAWNPHKLGLAKGEVIISTCGTSLTATADLTGWRGTLWLATRSVWLTWFQGSTPTAKRYLCANISSMRAEDVLLQQTWHVKLLLLLIIMVSIMWQICLLPLRQKESTPSVPFLHICMAVYKSPCELGLYYP